MELLILPSFKMDQVHLRAFKIPLNAAFYQTEAQESLHKSEMSFTSTNYAQTLP